MNATAEKEARYAMPDEPMPLLASNKGGLLVEYGISDQDIAQAKERYSALTCDTPEGYEAVRKAIGEVRTTRTSIEKRRVDMKADALAYGRKVDGEAKRLTTLLLEIEEPLKAKKQAVDEVKEMARRAEEARLKAEEEARLAAIREAEEARLKAIRDVEEARLKAEAVKLAAERKEMEAALAKIAEANRLEREKIANEQRAAWEKLAAQQQADREKVEAERATAAALLAEVAEERRAVQAEKERLDRIEFERLARINAEQLAAAECERKRVAAEQFLIAEGQRKAELKTKMDAMRPDIEKVHDFAQRLLAVNAPDCNAPDARAAVAEAVAARRRMFDRLKAFGEKLPF